MVSAQSPAILSWNQLGSLTEKPNMIMLNWKEIGKERKKVCKEDKIESKKSKKK